MRLLLLTPEYENTIGGIMTFYRALAPALCAAGVELRVIEGSALYSAEDRASVSWTAWRSKRWNARVSPAGNSRFPAFAALPGLRRHLAAAWAMWEQAGYGQDATL